MPGSIDHLNNTATLYQLYNEKKEGKGDRSTHSKVRILDQSIRSTNDQDNIVKEG